MSLWVYVTRGNFIRNNAANMQPANRKCILLSNYNLLTLQPFFLFSSFRRNLIKIYVTLRYDEKKMEKRSDEEIMERMNFLVVWAYVVHVERRPKIKIRLSFKIEAYLWVPGLKSTQEVIGEVWKFRKFCIKQILIKVHWWIIRLFRWTMAPLWALCPNFICMCIYLTVCLCDRP